MVSAFSERTETQNKMFLRHAFIFPILVGIWCPLTFLVLYVIAVLNKDVNPVFPYISDTGTWSPESCIFALMLTVGALFMIVTMYIRYRQVRSLCEKNEFKPLVKRYNRISFYMGSVAVFGVILVANFQETNVFSVHLAGAITCFGLGSIYQCLQARISFAMLPIFGKRSISIIRTCCAVICCVTFLTTFATAAISWNSFKGDDPTKWSPEDGGYVLHLVSTGTEWILAITTMVFLALYTSEFRNISFSEPLMITKGSKSSIKSIEEGQSRSNNNKY